MADPERKPNSTPENPQKGIEIVPPNIDEFWEKMRGYNGEIPISRTQINDQLFEFEETSLVLSNGGLHVGFVTRFTHSKEKLFRDSGCYNQDKRGNIQANLIKGIEAYKNDHDIAFTNTACNFCFHLSYLDYDYLAEIGLGNASVGELIEQKIKEWEKINIPPKQGILSNREYDLLRKDYQAKLQEYKQELGCLTNDFVVLDASRGTTMRYCEDFQSLIHNFFAAYKITLEAIYKAEDLPVPNLKITLSIPEIQPVVQEATQNTVVPMATKEQEPKREGFETIAGQDEAVAEAKKLVQAIKHPETYEKRGVKIPKGILFCGPHGTGKTMLAKAIAEEADASFFTVSGTDIHSKWYGESEERMQTVFDRANRSTTDGKKAIIFFDEFDALSPKRDEAYEATQRVIAVILENMDGVKANPNVIILAATNRIDEIDTAIKRSGRFDKIIEVPLPNSQGRIAILKKHMENAMKKSSEPDTLFAKDLDFEEISLITNGMSGADLANLVNQVLEEKLTDELNGKAWTPVSTNEIIDTTNKIILSRTEKIAVKIGKD
jgi:ATP-dependent 26S proteasome regulatory subunit